MPLTLVKEGIETSVVRVGGKEGVRYYPKNVGFVLGVNVTVVSTNNSNIIVNIKESRVAMDKEMADKVMVQTGREYEKERGTNKMCTSKKVKCKSMVAVAKLHGEGTVEHRIMDMGITKGTEVYVRKVVPLEDPVEVNVRGCKLPSRKADIGMVEVQ